jgi:hypothetical protein
MLSLTKTTLLKPEDVIKRAVDFFGPKGLGLVIKEEDHCTVYLEGGGGGVRVLTSVKGKGTTVDVETREWESQTKDFMAKIKSSKI